ncbi:Rrf2 family transcriptional regulator [Streptomyces sp. LP05-1]|uniref:Rrf2 family transcriptional regulator n=1 Tax=Streptomyces pyxinae TaxID=2970734 RepID=A0ABT2CCU6_9ACTN|nr:Rrf2 family transcriptional regulator [Streptomyces sp. LP05-1]MCS0634937.1 Rrf2 family transcriptional regulator [Streptomyces sp. LP05-1]
MRLTKATDLALRVMMRLAVAGDELLVARRVAEDMRVPYTHVAKVVAQLQRLGVVETRRGRGGGLALTAGGRTGSIGVLVRRLEGVGDVVDCEGEVPCPLAGACRLRGALRRAQEAFYATLDPLTVDELVGPPTGPVLLGIGRREGRAPG